MKPCRICGDPPAPDRAKKRDWLCRKCYLSYKSRWREVRSAKGLRVNGTPASPETRRRWMDNPEQKHRAAVRARTRRAIRRGQIQKLPCWCGDLKSEPHHLDYSDYMNVVWLCHKHHGATWRKAEGK